MKALFAPLFVLTAALLTTGCAHNVVFSDVDYSVDTEQHDAALIAVITEEHRAERVPIRSAMTGAAHRWEAQPGKMLAQVAEVELPQMFARTTIAGSEPDTRDAYILHLEATHYTFAHRHATFHVHARLVDPEGNERLDTTYEGSGRTYGARMFWLGAFGMKSAMRNSSLEALQEVFESLRADLAEVVDD